MKKNHSDQSKYKCTYCEFATNFLGNAWEHSLNMHPQLPSEFTPEENENIALRIVVEQTTTLANEIENLKKVVNDTFTEMKNAF